jgi:hypothetical protein
MKSVKRIKFPVGVRISVDDGVNERAALCTLYVARDRGTVNAATKHSESDIVGDKAAR